METKLVKVLHVDSEMGWRGGQQQAVYLFEAMHKKGYDTSFICCPSSKLANYLEDKSLPCHTLKFKGEIDLIAGLQLALYARQKGYRILHLHSGHALSWGLWAKLFNRKLILIATRRVDFPIKKNLFSRIKYLNPWIDRHVAISDNIRNVMISDGIPEQRITTIHSGVDVLKNRDAVVPSGFREQWKICHDGVIVGTVAAFVGHKDYPTLIKAAAIVVKTNPKVYFMAVGDGVLQPKMQTLAADLGISDHFIFCGFQTRVGDFLKAFDIYVMASKLEGLGTSVLDALALGLPVIGTRAGGIPEMIEDGKNGLLVDKKNPGQLASAILRMVGDTALMKSLGKNAAASVKLFSIENTIGKNIELYHRLINASIKRILFIQTAFIGDVILSTPLPRALKTAFPKSEIDVLVIPQTAIIYRNNPDISRIYAFDKRNHMKRIPAFIRLILSLRRQRYDVAISVHVSFTSSLIMCMSGIKMRVGYPRQKLANVKPEFIKGLPVVKRSLQLMKAFSDKSFEHQTLLYPGPEEIAKVERFIAEYHLESVKLVAIAPGSVWETKKWPADYYSRLIELITENGYKCVMIGGKEDRSLCDTIIAGSGTDSVNAAGCFSLLESAVLIQKCRLIICNDSSPLHLANAMKTPVLAFFGPTVRRFGFFPYQSFDRVLEIDLGCRPCGKHGHNKCPLGHFECMLSITPEFAYNNFMKMED